MNQPRRKLDLVILGAPGVLCALLWFFQNDQRRMAPLRQEKQLQTVDQVGKKEESE